MRIFNFSVNGWILAICSLLVLLATDDLSGQEYSYYFRVYFKDKGENITSNYSLRDLLSSKALDRRKKAGIVAPDCRDIPVFKGYLDRISSSGSVLHCTSKWMNTALFKSVTLPDLTLLTDLPFVNDVKIVKTPGKKSSFSDKLDFEITQDDFPPFDTPVTMVNGYPLHYSDYNGSGVLIAVLDGGFLNLNQISSIATLRNRNGIKATYDFVHNNRIVDNISTHGTAVLSVLAGEITGEIEGTAPGSDYLLLRTEDVESEFPCEEDFWAAGAEFADSAGADIITSSLGYYNFDNPSLNYKYTDLDGNSAFITRVADIAASKGILVVNSAGNERTKAWRRIIFPADGDSVVAIGAVDGNSLISSFSSAGPSADRRVKPDNVAMGVSVPVQVNANSTGRSNGTSFSCPVISGMAACLMQAVPDALNTDIINAIHSSADRYNSPDSLYGYGIPNMNEALNILQDKYIKIPDEEIITYPNPTSGYFEIIFHEPPESFSIEIITMSGRKIFKKEFNGYAGRTLRISELQNCEQGIYFIRLTGPSGTSVHKIIKIKD